MSVVIEGYASRFYEPDLDMDVTVPGAFLASLDRLPEGFPMLFEHQGRPVGVWEAMGEDAEGLFVRGRVEDPRLVEAAKAGQLWGLSIGYLTERARQDQGRYRVLSGVDLKEVSLVRAPLLPSAGFSVVGG